MAVNSLTSSQSSLAAELMLNKIMNGQVSAGSGKTISASGRALASTLNGQAFDAGAAEVNMAYGKGLVAAAQTQTTGIRDMLNNMKQELVSAINGGSTSTMFAALATDLSKTYSNLGAQASGASFNGVSLFSSTATSLNAGNGVEVDILGKNISSAAGGGTFASIKTPLAAVADEATAKAAVTAIDAAINELIGFESTYAMSIKELDDRALVLSDTSASLKEAASGQTISAMGGANSLLNNLLGNTSA